MKQFEVPACKEQRQFEDFIKTLLKVLADLSESETDLVLEYAMHLTCKNKTGV